MKGFNKKIILSLSLAIILFLSPCIASAAEITAGDFDSLKAAIEDPNRETELVVPGGDYNFTSTVNIEKDLSLKNKENENVKFIFGLQNDDSSKLGDTMIDVKSGKLTIDADNNDAIIFDGKAGGAPELDEDGKFIYNNSEKNSNTNTSDKGVFITVRSGAELEVNHGRFENVGNGGMQSAPLYVDGGKFTLNDGKISNNFATYVATIANNYLSESKDINSGLAKSAGVAVRSGTFIMNGGEISNNAGMFVNGAALNITGKVVNGAVLPGKAIINGGKIANNRSGGWANNSYNGAGTYVGFKGSLEVNNSEYLNNVSRGGGGAIFADWGTNLVINGGKFDGNSALLGGAIATHDRFVNYVNAPEPGDTADDVHGKYNPYGVKDFDQWKKMGFGTTFVVNDGTFTNNKALAGGAIYISNDGTQINKAVFDGNSASYYGGALYLSTNPYVLHLRNVLTENNISKKEVKTGLETNNPIETVLVNLPFAHGSGGSIWFCPVE